MQVSITWQSPIVLKDGETDGLIYTCELESVPEGPGIYVFGRGYGENIEPIYIGETLRLRQRIEQHLKYVPLMKALDNAKNGSRVLLVGELEGRRGVQAKKILSRVEHSLIKYALAQGYELVNKKGTRTPYDTIQFLGNRQCKHLFGSHMNIERNKRG